MVVLNDGRVWKHHVGHMRRDSMDRAVSDPSREMESVSNPSQALSVSLANVHNEMESGHRQV